jgi:hypothetical protein
MSQFSSLNSWKNKEISADNNQLEAHLRLYPQPEPASLAWTCIAHLVANDKFIIK